MDFGVNHEVRETENSMESSDSIKRVLQKV